ncbi:hypothetical protein CAPTEDRAFT_209002 [Capitella teleta]|uniref:Methyltransferase domain-containing protein n=1 Tax=Capitella teleta TaxID=283909 RepID=R7V7C0_CAPTE|nr:hypothetical protein CAPTEDRAFT_209002 [Capitella teleta]|eukprot:ELU11655.1 hypothetical protein CAPTEDRAFT_209002 [Capitella teleta]
MLDLSWSRSMSIYRFLEDLSASCLISKRFGTPQDGGWDVCLAAPYALKSGCLVYSFGIGGEWSFDDQIASAMGCTVKSFDPTVKVEKLKHGPNVHMYEIGLGGKDEVNSRGWKIYSLPSLMEVMGDSEKILDYLKIDIEWSEYESFDTILTSNVVSHIKQIGLEVHSNDSNNYYPAWELVSKMEDHGFRVWAVEHNYATPFHDIPNMNIRGLFCCSNVYFINERFLDEFTTQKQNVEATEGMQQISSDADLKSAEDAFARFIEMQRPDLCIQSSLQGHHLNWDVCLSKGILKQNSCRFCLYTKAGMHSLLSEQISLFARKNLNCTTKGNQVK